MNNIKIKTVISPTITFLGIWIIVCFLLDLKLSKLLDGLHEEFFIFLIKGAFCFILGYGYVFFLNFRKRVRKSILVFNERKLWGITKKTLFVWIIFNIIQVIYSGGIPILWYILGTGKGYFDFGIHGINGLMNSVLYILCINLYLLYKETNIKRYKYILITLCLWPAFLVTRQVIIVLLLELFFLVISMHTISIKVIIKTVIGIFLAIYLFGIAGDFRSGGEAFKQLAQPNGDWAYEIPSGVLWVYMYMSTPIANIQNIFETISPSEGFQHSLSMLLPSPIRSLIYPSGLDDDNAMKGLITEAFNVSTFLNEFYLDYGTVYVYIALFIIGTFSKWVYDKVRYELNYFSLLYYMILSQILTLSIFYNHFLYLPVVFQFIVVSFFSYQLSKGE